CSVCGLQDRVVAMMWPSGPVCSTCHKKALSAKGICSGCSRRRRIDPRDPRRRGLCSDCAGLEPWSVCDTCGVEERIYDSGRCIGCTLDHRLAELIGGSTILAPLRNTLAGSGGPRAALRWLSKPETKQVLGAMAQGELAVTHDALDELPPTGSLEHLRQVLVVARVLPERDEATARLEAWVQAQLDGIEVIEDRRVVEAFANWWVLRRYRWRVGKYGIASDKYARCLVRGAVDFLTWAREHGLSLGDCTQAHVELWMAGPPSRSQARDFLRWACRRRLAHDLDIVRRPDVIPGRSVDADEHLLLAQRFAYDETLPLVDRVAGLFLLCYGQPLSRLTRLKIGHVTTSSSGTSIRFGRTEVELLEVVGGLVGDLVANRKGRASTGASDQSPWLFPGAQPGRPITSDRLGLRLGAYGIDARAARTSLMLDLAAELGPRFLADLLGMHPGTAVRWVRAANGDWSGYAAARARR
ncbi:MAG: hypothetical protein M3256_26320, partial [Actinomycetota bacterium]|nr:hypothetical protein [Actinomycetota bacterium]